LDVFIATDNLLLNPSLKNKNERIISMSDASNIYNSAVGCIHNLKAMGDAFVGGHYEPGSVGGDDH
tara:strand:- start:298 stop:495 length:198 start_codon:yes stop_codon:yes gene_type:complete